MTHTRTDVAEAIEAGAQQIETYGLTPLRFIDAKPPADVPETERACCPIGGIRARAGLYSRGDDKTPVVREALSELAAYVVEHEATEDQNDPDLTIFRWVGQFAPVQACEVAAVMRRCAKALRGSS